MSWDRQIPTSATPEAVKGDDFMDACQDEFTGLADNSNLLLTNVAGDGDVITADLAPALIDGLKENMKFIFVPNADNTGAAAITINGEPSVDLVTDDGNPLGAGVLKTGVARQLWFDGADLRVMGTSSAIVIRNRQVFDSSGTWNKPANANPDGITIIEAWGQGGGGHNFGAGSAGGSGAHRFYRVYRTGDLPSSMSVTVAEGDNTAQDGANTVIEQGGTTYALAYGGARGAGVDQFTGGVGSSHRGIGNSPYGGGENLVAGDTADGNAGGGGGGARNVGAGQQGSNGGGAEYGGGGGGGGTNNELGGSSFYGGDGGNTGLPGQRPGGGGGGNASGGPGRAIITTIA